MKLIIIMSVFVVLFIAGCVQEQKCGVEQCHGLELTCGSDVPDACTEIYKLGDFCRMYFSGCEIVDDMCVKITNITADIQFFKCKSCVSDCESVSDSSEAFECESECRTQMKMFCEQDNDCACGKDIETGNCFYGNKNYVEVSEQCPDFCTGIAGNLIIKCVDNTCTQITAKNEADPGITILE